MPEGDAFLHVVLTTHWQVSGPTQVPMGGGVAGDGAGGVGGVEGQEQTSTVAGYPLANSGPICAGLMLASLHC